MPSPRLPRFASSAAGTRLLLLPSLEKRALGTTAAMAGSQEKTAAAGGGVSISSTLLEMQTSYRYDDDYLITSLKRNEVTDDLRTNSKKKRTTITRSLTKRERCNEGDLHRDLNQGVRSELSEEAASNLSKSVVSLSLSDGHMVLFACSGIAVQRVGCVTKFCDHSKLGQSTK